jgi:hypothetical protein
VTVLAKAFGGFRTDQAGAADDDDFHVMSPFAPALAARSLFDGRQASGLIARSQTGLALLRIFCILMDR